MATDDDICLRCEDVVPDWVRTKHLGAQKPRPESHKDCQASCVFDGKPIFEVAVFCGRSYDERRNKRPLGAMRAIANFEDNGYSHPFNGELIVRFTDKDTPCAVVIHADLKDPNSEAKAIALGRDVASALTPEVVAKRRTVEAIVWAQDKTGQRAQAELESWGKESAALKELATFPAGFPKLLDHQSKPALPEGKKSLLLGYCATTKADGMVKSLQTALPGIAWYRIPAEGLAVACPTEPNHVGSITSKKAKLGSEELSVVTLDARSPTRKDERGEERRIMLVLSFLRDKSGRLLASDQKEVDAQSDRFGKVKIQPSEGGLTVETEVDLKEWKGPPCSYRVRVKVQVKDGKIASEEDADGIPGCYCCRGE